MNDLDRALEVMGRFISGGFRISDITVTGNPSRSQFCIVGSNGQTIISDESFVLAPGVTIDGSKPIHPSVFLNKVTIFP